MYDPDRYRDKAEIEEWRHRDYSGMTYAKLRERGWLQWPCN